MLLSAVSVLVVAQSSSEIPGGITLYINKSLITIRNFLLLLTNYFNIVLDGFTVVFL